VDMDLFHDLGLFGVLGQPVIVAASMIIVGLTMGGKRVKDRNADRN